MSLWVPHSAFWDWQVDFVMPSLKYSYTLHAKFGVSKPVIVINRCVVKSCLLLQICSVSLKLPRPKILYLFHIVFGILMTSSGIYICTLTQHSMSTCRQNKHTQRHLVEAANAIPNFDNWFFIHLTSHFGRTFADESLTNSKQHCVKVLLLLTLLFIA